MHRLVLVCKCRLGGGFTLMGTQNLGQINEVEVVIQCVIAGSESDKSVPPMKQLSWH